MGIFEHEKYQWYAPPGIPGQMLGKGGEFAVGIFPEGLVLSQDNLSRIIPLSLCNLMTIRTIINVLSDPHDTIKTLLWGCILIKWHSPKCLWEILCESPYPSVTHCPQPGEMRYFNL